MLRRLGKPKHDRAEAATAHAERIAQSFAIAAGPLLMAVLRDSPRGREALQGIADATSTMLRSWEAMDGSPAAIIALNTASTGYLRAYHTALLLGGELMGA